MDGTSKDDKKMAIKINEHISLEIIADKHSALLFEAIDTNRRHLSGFLPWVPYMQSEEQTLDYIQNCRALHKQQKEVSFVIMSNEAVIGRIGLHHWDHLNRCAAIGYWLAKDAEGKGIVTKCCIAIIDYGFEKMGLQRIEIKAAVKNIRSLAIPNRLGFRQEGILRQAELVNGEFLDLVIFSFLRDEWKQNQ